MQVIWSEEAKCYDAKYTSEGGTILFYKCLITGNKKQITHPEKLALSAYKGRTGQLVEIVEEKNIINE